MVNIALLAESNKQDQQLVPVGTKVVEVILPLFQGHAPSHVSVATHAIIATSVVATSGYFGAFCWSIMATINASRVNFEACCASDGANQCPGRYRGGRKRGESKT